MILKIQTKSTWIADAEQLRRRHSLSSANV